MIFPHKSGSGGLNEIYQNLENVDYRFPSISNKSSKFIA